MNVTLFISLLCVLNVNGQLLWSSSSDTRGDSNGIMSMIKGTVGKRIHDLADFSRWLISPATSNQDEHSDQVDYIVSSRGSTENNLRLRESNATTNDMSMADYIFKNGRRYFSASNIIRQGYETFVGVSSCFMGQEFNDATIGSLELNSSYYCNYKCGRMIPGLTCCTPQSPDVIDPKLILFRRGREHEYLNWRSIEDGKKLANEKRIVFIVHGWIEKISYSQWITDMVEGYLALGDAAIVVDWRGGNPLQYWQATANIRTVGAVLGHAIGSWNIADRTLFVGFSLGGQMIVETAKYLKTKFNQQMDECHGLDPAGPFFDGCDEDLLLDRSNCRLVQVIHTSAADLPVIQAAAVRFGSYKKSGHCDYWVNCGHNQGPCTDLDFTNFVKSIVRLGMMSDAEILNWACYRLCSHWRAPNIYNAALRSERKCPAYACPHCGRSQHFCTPSNVSSLTADDALPPFSKCSPNDNVNYYVQSMSAPPFCTD